jgi:hypothetical protein
MNPRDRPTRPTEAHYQLAHTTRSRIETALAAEREKVRVLREALEKARNIAYAAPELNMCNYDHEQVRQLNDRMIEVFQILDAALAATEKSL